MPFVASAFHQLLEPLDRRSINRIVAAHGGNHGVGEGGKAWTCQRHLKAMLFAQIAGLNSLREIEQGLAAAPRALYHLDLRPVSRSTLSDAQALRPSLIFRDICRLLMDRANRKLRREGTELIQLVDASPIALRDPRFDWAEADSRTRGLKLHIGYDPRADLPSWMDLTSAKISDITAAREAVITPGAVYVFDKGYGDYNWWSAIHSKGGLFVTRLKANACRRDVTPRLPKGDGILTDNDIKIGHAKPRGGATNALFNVPLREINVERPDKEPLVLITNDLNRPASEIAQLYKERWQIELLFKWLKQNLKIKRFIGRSQNAVKIQIYVALIAFLLLRLFRQTHAKSHEAGAKALVARLRVSLFNRFDLMKPKTPPPRHPTSLPPSPQLALKLAL